MSDKLQRLLEKAKTKRRNRPDTILIGCLRPEDVPARVDTLIAAGNLTEADRPYCMFWPNPDLVHWDGTRDEWVLMQAKNKTPEDLEIVREYRDLTENKDTTPEEFQRLWDGMVADARAAVLAAANSGTRSSKKRKTRFPVNRL